MEQEAARADYKIATESDQEDLIMSVATTADDALDTQPHEKQVGQGVDDLGGVNGGIVVLTVSTVAAFPSSRRGTGRTSSHQFSVEVTGLQNPAFAGGYGMKGKDHRIVKGWRVDRKQPKCANRS